jgi:DNA-binding CsgD family transcriptional regulator/tetratricopeptide (TPR) repeat protein
MVRGHVVDTITRPPLVERADLLATMTRLAGEVSRGRGHLVLLSGEAGVGKSALVEALVDAVPTTLDVRRGGCDNVTTPAPLGPFLEAVPELAEVPAPRHGEDNAVLFRAATEALGARPSLVVLEDVHWADGASLDLLRHLGRRIDRTGVVIVATFRSDELGPAHPLRVVLGDLATAAGVERLEVPALTPAGVQQLAAGTVVDATGLHARTGGNAFYVTEVLASGADELPDTVTDAVLARAARLSAGARRTLEAAAVLGPGTDAVLLADVADRPVPCVDECVARGVLVRDGDTVAFRHELARRAIEATTSFATRRDLHAAALAALVARGSHDDRRLAHHAEACGDRDAVLAHGLAAAELARSLGAHREAAEHYRQVADVLPADALERADVLGQLANALCLTGHPQEALEVQHRGLELHRAAQDAVGAGRALRWISRLSWMLGRGAVSGQFAHRAIETLEPLGRSHELAMAYSNLAQIYMLSDDVVGAREWGGRALAIADELDDSFIRAHALNNVGTALATGEQLDVGTGMLRESLDIALVNGFVDHAARAYCNLSVTLATHRHYAAAEQVMDEGIAYCADRDLDYYGDYVTAMRAKTAVERGAFDEAGRLADRLLAIPHLSVVARIPTLTCRGLLAAVRGEDPTALLAEARRLSKETREPQRLVPVALAVAEAAWITGRPDEVVSVLDDLWRGNIGQPQAWRTGELGWWLHLVGDTRELPGPAAGPFALMLAGRHREAARAWRELGSPLWAAKALATSDDVEDVRRGVGELEALGATGLRDAVLADRRRRGLPSVRGPRPASAEHPAGLTTREVEVLELLAAGLTNAQISEALFVSPKTAGHHVSAVLRKLDAPSRSRAVAVATARGLLGRGPETG